MKKLQLYESLEDMALGSRQPVVRHFGGTKIYAATQKDLDSGTTTLFASILRVGEKRAGLNISSYRREVGKDLGLQIPERLFSALLGRQLRDGNLDTVICEGSQGTAFRVVFARNRLVEFDERIEQVGKVLISEKMLVVSKIRDMYFKERSDWEQGMYIAARLVRLGVAVFNDRFRISMPSVIRNARQLSDR